MITPTMSHEAEIEQLRAENRRLEAERDAAAAERDVAKATLQAEAAAKATLEQKVSHLEQKLDALLKKLWGRSSEKQRGDPKQASLGFPGLEEPADAADALPTPPYVGEAPDGEPAQSPKQGEKKKRKGHGWGNLPKDLRRETTELSPTAIELQCACCGGEKTSIGSPEITERLDFKPASIFVARTVRQRYRCPTCQDGTTVAPLPPTPLEGERGRAEAGLLAQIAVAKFADHLPLNRQQSILAREGVHLSRSTLADWTHGTASLLRPIVGEVRRSVLSRDVVGTDETGVRVVYDKTDPARGTRNARIWVYRGLPGEVLFTISETKAKKDEDGPLAVLEHYQGFVQADAAGTFDDLFLAGSGRVEVGCNVHDRRKWVEAKASNPQEAAFALATFRAVYEIEARVRDASPEQRLAARQTETKPLLAVFDEWVDALAASPALVPGTPLAKAVGYSRNHRVALRRFLDDPRLSPDNNAVERALRLVAVGRKNWLFAGSEQAAYDAATHYTLVAGCKDLGIDPWEYYHDVIKRRVADPSASAAALTPRAWWEAKRAAEPAAR